MYLFSVFRIGKMYIVKGYPQNESFFSYLTTLNVETAHRRFCHMSFNSFQILCKNKCFKDIEKLDYKVLGKKCC